MFSCSSKKVFTEKTSLVKNDSIVSKAVQKDSISNVKKTIIIPAVSASLVLSNPCDTLGILKQNTLSTTIGKLKLNITTDPKTKKIFIHANYDSIKSVYESKYQKLYRSDSLLRAKIRALKIDKSKKVIKYRLGIIGWLSIILNVFLIILLFKIK